MNWIEREKMRFALALGVGVSQIGFNTPYTNRTLVCNFEHPETHVKTSIKWDLQERKFASFNLNFGSKREVFALFLMPSWFEYTPTAHEQLEWAMEMKDAGVPIVPLPKL